MPLWIMLDYTSQPLSEKTVTLPLAFPWKCSIIKAPGCTLYLLHIHLQTELRLPLLLSTGGLGLNYIWAEAAIQSGTQLYIGRLVQNIREVLRRGISLCNMPGASRVLANTGTALCTCQDEGSKPAYPFQSSLSFHLEGQHSPVSGIVEWKESDRHVVLDLDGCTP